MFSDRGLQAWLPTYLKEVLHRRRLRSFRRQQLVHVVFLVCDHFEPRHGAKTPDQPQQRLRDWHAGYQQMQDEISRRFGQRPLHTWFYPPHHGLEHLPALARMAYSGLGEVELHYHHDKDTEATLRRDLLATLAAYRRFGLLQQLGSPPVERFGFIHGDWALDNSGHGKYCGVNSELALLQELGCWGDLTMPSANSCQTRKINSIYYAEDDRERPKSHDWGSDARANAVGQAGLLLIQGPLGINFGSPRYPRIENASLTTANWGRRDRIEAWLDCHVHVRGRPDWLFVKLHTHGAIEQDMPALFGDQAMEMHRLLNEQFNDGKQFRLHYVTARQAMNVIRAAESGCDGSPGDYLDFVLPPQTTSMYCLDVPHTPRVCTSDSIEIRNIEFGSGAQLWVNATGISALSGSFSGLRIDPRRGQIQLQCESEANEIAVTCRSGAQLVEMQGASVRGVDGGGRQLLKCGRTAEFGVMKVAGA